MWARASACLVVSPLAFLLGGALTFGAIAESYGREPRDWLVIALAVLGIDLFALGATTWVRALGLIVRARRSNA